MSTKRRLERIEKRAVPGKKKYAIAGSDGSKIEMPAKQDKTLYINIDLSKI